MTDRETLCTDREMLYIVSGALKAIVNLAKDQSETKKVLDAIHRHLFPSLTLNESPAESWVKAKHKEITAKDITGSDKTGLTSAHSSNWFE